ncbi:MAG: FRG domain-containing protein [Ruminiclostridium sp.]
MYIEKYIEELNELTKGEKRLELVFRGQSRDWKTITSSASRRMKNNNQSSNQSDFIKYHKILLKNARENGYTHPDNSNINLKALKDLELLANIQHMGGATCLTDFTTNFLIALWFATSTSKDDTDGKLFVINLKSSENKNLFKNISKEDDDIDKILTYKTEPGEDIVRQKHFWVWKPEKYNKRIHHQNSVFIFGLPPITGCKIIIIEKEKKIEIRRELKDYFNLDVEYLFPDFPGFSFDANSPEAPFNYFFCHDCIDIAYDYLEEKHYNDSIRYLDKFIICKKKNESKCRRRNGVSCKNNLSDAYFYKGECLYRSTKIDTDKYEKDIRLYKGECLYHSAEMDTSKYDDQLETLSETFIEAISYFEKLIDNKEYSADSFKRILDIYYDILRFEKKAFSDTIYKCESIINTYNSNIEKHNYYVYFSLIELAILTNNNLRFKELMVKVNNIEELKTSNGKFLIDYFDCIGKAIWDDEDGKISRKEYIKELNEQIVNIQKAIPNSDKSEIGEFLVELSRNFEDIMYWINSEINHEKPYYSDLLSLTNKMKSLQDIWTEYSYSLEKVT